MKIMEDGEVVGYSITFAKAGTRKDCHVCFRHM